MATTTTTAAQNWRIELIDCIDAVRAADWNALAGTDYPFARHEFLHALEASGAVSRRRGWQPRHALVWQDDVLAAALPLYETSHSYGEYVFDWSWAEAYHRHGLDYYPKWVAAIPFTPATGPRLCVAPGQDRRRIAALLLPELQRRAHQRGISSVHVLFPDEDELGDLAVPGFLHRTGLQYHWFNRGHDSFDDFLAACSARRRKNLRRERRRVTEQGLKVEMVAGEAIDELLWQRFYRFYQLTYARRSGHGGYLDLDFFLRVGRSLPDHTLMAVAHHGSDLVAAALYFQGGDTLYGRYWGCEQDFDALHFEACYYQGIDHCIRHGLARFDAGAQGEHKIQRGFEPVYTHSRHWLDHPGFQQAVGEFLQREAASVASWKEEARQLLPWRRSER